MKNLLLSVLVAAALSASASAQSTPNRPAQDAYRIAVQTYVEAALVQMQAYRWEIDAAVKAAPDERARFDPAYALVKRGEELIVRLRSAPPSEFDVVKSMFEKNRAELDRVLGKVPPQG